MSSARLPCRIAVLDVAAAHADRLRYQELCQPTARAARALLQVHLARLDPESASMDEDLLHSLALEFAQGLWSSLLYVWRHTPPQADGCVPLGFGRCRVPAQVLRDVHHFGIPATDVHELFEHILAGLRDHAGASPFVALPANLKLAKDDAEA